MTTALTLTATDVALAPGREEAERTASHMAREYREATAEIARLLLAVQEQTQRLHAAIPADYNPFDVRLSYEGDHYINLSEPAKMFDRMKRKAWRVLVDHLGVKNIMSVAKRKEFEQQLERGDLPEISEKTITGIILGLAGQARDFAKEAALEVFGILRPRAGWGREYKTNDAFRVGRRVILTWKVERCWNAKQFRVCYNSEQQITAIDGVFHILDGKGIMREHKGPLVKAIEASPDGRGDTDYFKFRCFKNRNLHLEMKRLDLVKQLNLLAAGEAVLGNDMTE
jgi:Domain of unknown function (DUF4942)